MNRNELLSNILFPNKIGETQKHRSIVEAVAHLKSEMVPFGEPIPAHLQPTKQSTWAAKPVTSAAGPASSAIQPQAQSTTTQKPQTITTTTTPVQETAPVIPPLAAPKQPSIAQMKPVSEIVTPTQNLEISEDAKKLLEAFEKDGKTVSADVGTTPKPIPSTSESTNAPPLPARDAATTPNVGNTGGGAAEKAKEMEKKIAEAAKKPIIVRRNLVPRKGLEI